MPDKLAERASSRLEGQPAPKAKQQIEQTFIWALSIVVGLIVALPAFLAWQSTPPGSSFLGYVFSSDDQMVYAAWIRQAMANQFLFDNRFTTASQPGLTINLYFLAVGQIARITGIVFATHLVRVALSVLLVHQLFALVRRLNWPVYETKLAVTFSIFAGGMGFLVWHTFGVAIVRPTPEFLSALLSGRLPIDVWQPEAFTLPSMLTNGLFIAALNLIIYIFQCFLDAQHGWKPVLPGAVAMLVLMNIHSYDVLLIALVMFGFLVMEWARDRTNREWIVRAFTISAGVIPAALWFLYVLKNDPVFQARAATLTFAPSFRSVLSGIIFPLLLSIPILLTSRELKKRSTFATVLVLVVYLGLAIFAGFYQDGYFLNWVTFGGVYLFLVFLLYSLASLNPARNLVVAWAVLSPAVLYFPALFQRKLAMGMIIPWGILAAGGAGLLLAKQARSGRNLVTILAITVICASSLRWVTREFNLARANVGNTTVHTVYLTADMTKAISALDKEPGKKVVIALPGLPSPVMANGVNVPDEFESPVIPDLNAVATGFTGAYSIAGHWSETPGYNQARNEVTRLFLASTTADERRRKLKELGVTHIIAPHPESFPGLGLADMRECGEEITDGTSFSLVRVK
jgi:arabinosyltransferase C